MSERVTTRVVGSGAVCMFCTDGLASDDRIASIKVLSYAHGERYLGAHVICLQKTVRAEHAGFIDLDDVPPGMDHFLMLGEAGR
jgi:hypothetical protein